LGPKNPSVAGGKITYANVKMLLDMSMNPPTNGGGGGTPADKTVSDSGTLASGAWKHLGPFSVGAGKTLTATMTGGGDADLYVRMDGQPTTDAYLARGYTTSGNETITYTATSNGTLYIGVSGYEASSFTLKTSDN